MSILRYQSKPIRCDEDAAYQPIPTSQRQDDRRRPWTAADMPSNFFWRQRISACIIAHLHSDAIPRSRQLVQCSTRVACQNSKRLCPAAKANNGSPGPLISRLRYSILSSNTSNLRFRADKMSGKTRKSKRVLSFLHRQI